MKKSTTTGERIKERRKELGLSQRELAARLGYTDHTTVTRIEGGKVELTHSRLIQFANVLGVSAIYLMGMDDEPEDLGALAAEVLSNAKMLQLMKNVRKLSGADFETVCTLVDSLANKKGQR